MIRARAILIAAVIGPGSIVGVVPTRVGYAQRAPDDTNKTFFIRRDLYLSAGALAGTAIISGFDKRIAHWWQSPGVQGSSSRNRLVNDLTKVN